MNYTIYTLSDGLIVARGSYTNPSDAPIMPDGFGLLEDVIGDPRSQKVENGVLVPYTPPPPPVQVPWSVSPWQMRRALNQLGLRATVEAAVAAGDQDTKDGWDYASEFRRDNALLLGMATALNLTETDLDNLFILASTFV